MILDPITQFVSNPTQAFLKGLRAIGTHAPNDLESRPSINAFELEARVLYSAGPIALEMVDAPGDTTSHETFEPLDELGDSTPISVSTQDSFLDLGEEATFDAGNPPSENSISQIVFVDSNVANLDQIISELQNSPSTEIVVLQANADGVAQISTALAQRSGIGAVHILSHGSAGQIHLGATTLSNENLTAFSEEISGWSSSMSSGADILFYGCELASDLNGQDFIEEIGILTGSDVAASNDLTGHASLGGDWDLEFVRGEISTQVIASQTLQENWISALAAPPTDGSGAIWITTRGGASAGGLSWDETNITQLGNPDLELETPDSDGTFESTGFSFPGEIRGFHRVEAVSVTVGDTTLQRGDLLLALGENIDFGSFDAGRHDIVLFRPDSATDYSSGTYHMFLEEAVHSGGGARNIHGLSLIESDVDVGGHLLTEGELVVSRSGSNDDDLFVVEVVTTSFGATNTSDTNNEQRLIKGEGSGTNLDFDGEKIEAIEVLENAITIGGRTLAAGTILLTIDTDSGQDVSDGGSSVVVHGEDILALTVNQTEFDGSTDVTPFRLLNGSDIGLNNSNEKIYGLSVISPAAASVDHVVTVDTTDDIVDGSTSSITALLADRGADGRISLREAIEAANNTSNAGSTPDEIRFDIPLSDLGRVYYQDNGVANSLGDPSVTNLDDSSIVDFDPDYAFTPHSWFRIDLDNALPQLEITDAVQIDGYTQSGATENTLSIGQNANLKIEITNSTVNGSGSGEDNNVGLSFLSGSNGSTLRGISINSFGNHGVLIDAGVHDITLQGNFIGTDVSGTQARENAESGILIRSNDNQIGGSNVADRNIISGNATHGIAFSTSGTLVGNLIENNYIGVDATGTNELSNGGHGVLLSSNDGVQIIDNVISGNQGDGIHAANGTTVQNMEIRGNLIGVAADGITGVGNDGSGIRIDADDAHDNVLGGTTSGDGNVISANGAYGILLDGDAVYDSIIVGNFIGTDTSSTAILGNGSDGIFTTRSTSDSQIGGLNGGEANTIANNAGNGVLLSNLGAGLGYRNSIRGNRFLNNAGLAIDIMGDGVSANDYTSPIADGDNGPNRVQNFPDLLSVDLDGGDLTITGELFGRNNINYTIDFYATGTPDSSSHGEAARYLGTIQRTTDGSGFTSFATVLNSVSISLGESVTATATHSDGSTSEFSLNRIVTASTTEAPTTSGVADLIVAEDSPGYFLDLFNVFEDAQDADAALVYSIENNTNPGLFSSLFIDPSRFLRVSFAADQNGDSEITVRATDTDGNFIETSFQVDVTPVNDDPEIINPIDSYIANEDDRPSTISLLTTFADIDDPTLTYTIVSNDTPGLLNASISGSDLTFEYMADEYGNSNVVIRATDSEGAFVDHSIAVTVNAVNDIPVITDKTYELEEFGEFAGNLLSDAFDTDGDSITASLVTPPQNGTVLLRPDGTFVYTPNDGFFGADTFEFIATDGTGRSTIATAVLRVPLVPAPPVTESSNDTVEDEETLIDSSILPTSETADDRESADQSPSRSLRLQEQSSFASIEATSNDSGSGDRRQTVETASSYAFQSVSGVVSTTNSVDSLNEASLPISQQFFKSLASFDQEIDEATNSINYSFVNSVVSFSGFSLVAATWILRSGALLASMMANLPAWRIIDPLVVLGYSNDTVDGAETLHDIIENGQSDDVEDLPETDPSNSVRTTALQS